MQFALAQICVDDRLNHELLRIQIRSRLAESYLHCDHIFIVNEVGGNMGENFRNSVSLIQKIGGQIALAAVLHHDKCRAAEVGLRRPLEETIAQMAAFLAKSEINCLLVTGHIYTDNNYVAWQNEQRITPISARR